MPRFKKKRKKKEKERRNKKLDLTLLCASFLTDKQSSASYSIGRIYFAFVLFEIVALNAQLIRFVSFYACPLLPRSPRIRGKYVEFVMRYTCGVIHFVTKSIILFGIPLVFIAAIGGSNDELHVHVLPVTGNYRLRFERIFVMSEHVRT